MEQVEYVMDENEQAQRQVQKVAEPEHQIIVSQELVDQL